MLLHELSRLKQILNVFHKYGFTNYIREIGLHRHLPLHKRARSKNIATASNLRKAFEELGPSFVKLGQVLSLRPDILPKEFIKEMEAMQDRVPPFPFEQAKHIIESELNKTLREMYKAFPHKPIASASIAQVYKAKLHNNDIVAVKVQRPGIQDQLKTDIALMLHVIKLLEKHFPWCSKYHIRSVIEEFRDWTKNETNFLVEAENIELFQQNKLKHTIIPAVYTQFSREKVLTLEYLEGIELHNIDAVKKKHKNIKPIIENAYTDIIAQVFEYGLFHADPHPGNILVMSDKKIGLVDFGIIGEFDNNLRRQALELFLAIIEGNVGNLTKVLKRLGASKQIDSSATQRRLNRAILSLQTESINEVHVSVVLERILQICAEVDVHFPRDFILFAKTVITMEGLALKYDPTFKIVRKTKPLIRDLVKKNLSKSLNFRSIYQKVLESADIAEEIPQYTRDILNRIRSGKVSVHIESTEVKDITNELEHSSSNIALGAVIAALIIGSAVILESNINIVIPSVGIAVAIILGLWLAHRTIHIQRGE